MNNLDFYSLIEPILGLQEASFKLYNIYLKNIKNLKFTTNKALDFGCGNGKFASLLSKDFEVVGLDKSDLMLEKAKNLGIKTTKNLEGKFSLVTAVSDVLNYMQKDELKKFFKDISEHLEDGGYLIFDVNSYFGFNDIAQGLLYEEVNDDSLIIDANFIDNKLVTKMIYFQKQNLNYTKSMQQITQYYHDRNFFTNIKNLSLIKEIKIKLYSDFRSDKILYIYKKG